MNANVLPRGLEVEVRRAWQQSAVVIVEGLRATGKTTLARTLVDPGSFASLGNAVERRRALADPVGWLEAMPSGSVIDEAQLVPNLQSDIKGLLDRRGATAGQFLLTGSARLRTDEMGGSDPLVGRSTRLRLHPFTQSELAGQPLDVVHALFEDDPRQWIVPPCDHEDIIRRSSVGGFPLFRGPLSEDARARAKALDGYLAQLFSGDIYQTGRNADRILRTFRWIRARSGAIRNFKQFADALELHRNTLGEYLNALHDVHLLEEVPAYRPSLDKRETDKERLFVADPALVAAVLPAAPEELRRNTDGFSTLLETFTATEIIRLLTWSATSARLYHWRESDTNEVDLVLERGDGMLVGIEVKASRTADPQMFHGLRRLRDRYPRRFGRGYVIHSGDRVTRQEDDLWALPFSALWSIGADVGSTPPVPSVVERFRAQVAAIRSDDATLLALVAQRADELDRQLDTVVGWFEEFKKELEQANLQATVETAAGTRWSQSAPPKVEQETWRRYVRLNASGPNNVGWSITVSGSQLGDGTVLWTLQPADGAASIQETAAEGNHLEIIGRLLTKEIERLPEVIARLRS